MVHSALSFMQHIIEEQNNLYDIKLQYRNDDKEYLSILERSILDSWKEKHSELITIFNLNQFTWEDFECIRDFMQIIRGYFFANRSFKTISKEYQEICSFFIALTLQKKVLWANNFLKYFDPSSAYYNRIKALTLFRILQNPKKEIEWKLQIVSDLLYESVQNDPESFPKALSILKEYLDRVFSLTRKTIDQRVNFVTENESKSWISWYGTPELSTWLVHFFSTEPVSYEPTLEELKEASIKDAELYVKQQEQSLSEQKEQEILFLKQRVEELQRENLQLQNNINELLPRHSEVPNLSLMEKRQFYRIVIVWGSENANKSYTNLKKKKPDFLQEFGLHREQLELQGNYDLQKDRKFSKKIKDGLLLGNIDFVVALQTDHESPFANLIEDLEIWNRIMVFAKREGSANPIFTGQKFSQEKFHFYINKALEKYERELENTKSVLH